MKAKQKWLWLLLLVPLTGVSWQIYNYNFPAPPTDVNTGTGIFAKAGYKTLRLTMDYHAPGSLYTIDSQSEGFVSLSPICEVDASELANAIQVHRTTDISAAIESKLSAGFKVLPKNWSKLGIKADLTNVQDILAVYSDSRVELLSTEKIRDLRDSYLGRDGCFAAVKELLEHGYDVCQTQAVIVSDLVYEVTRGASSNIGVDGGVENLVVADTQSTGINTRTTKINGSKMYHAVKLHKFCILLNTAPAESGNKGAVNLTRADRS